jgi:hypothetical protein
MLIPLTSDEVAIIDDEDSDLAKFKWFIHHSPNTCYARRNFTTCKNHKRSVFIHRLIVGRMVGRSLNTYEHVDHINHNGLDNRRSNLRLSTSQENLQNRLIQKRPKTSRFKGVSWYKDGSKWRAYIYIN